MKCFRHDKTVISIILRNLKIVTISIRNHCGRQTISKSLNSKDFSYSVHKFSFIPGTEIYFIFILNWRKYEPKIHILVSQPHSDGWLCVSQVESIFPSQQQVLRIVCCQFSCLLAQYISYYYKLFIEFLLLAV